MFQHKLSDEKENSLRNQNQNKHLQLKLVRSKRAKMKS